MEIRWQHVFLAFAVILLLINLPLILNAASEILSGFSIVTTNALKERMATHQVRDYETFALVRFLVILIFFLGILGLIKGWSKK